MNWEQPTITEEEKKGMSPAQAGSILFVVLTVVVLLCYAVIFMNPQIAFNPFKPPAPVFPTSTTVAMDATSTPRPSPTSTPEQPFPPTWTPTTTPTPTSTRPPPTPTPTRTPTFTPGPTPRFALSYDVLFVKQKLYAGSENWWSGVAGEVATWDGKPVTDVTIRIWDDFGHVWETQPGNAPEYGDNYSSVYGGRGTYAWWEQFLFVSCQQSIKVHVQLISGGYKSREVTFDTTGNCEKNLVLVQFQKNY